TAPPTSLRIDFLPIAPGIRSPRCSVEVSLRVLRTSGEQIARSPPAKDPTGEPGRAAATLGPRSGSRPSAAALKFLHHPTQARLGTSNRKAALESYAC